MEFFQKCGLSVFGGPMRKDRDGERIPVQLSAEMFERFILPHLSPRSRGPDPKLSDLKVTNYILKVLHTGCQWPQLSIDKDENGKPEIHYTRIYKTFRRWEKDGCIDAIFAYSVKSLSDDNKLDTTVIHGDGTTQAAKKGGDNIGYSGHKKIKGDKVVAFCDRNCNIIAPFVTAAANQNESPLFREALPKLMRIGRQARLSLQGSAMSLDAAYDCAANRKAIFNRGMVPNINENKRNRKHTKRGRKRKFSKEISKERFQTIERIFAWEDKFRRVLIRFERLSNVYYALKTLAYTMINLRHYHAA
jgi:transposase